MPQDAHLIQPEHAQERSSAAPELSIVIPMYREARRIGPTLQGVADYARGSGKAVELVLVDDGSDDQTERAARGGVAAVGARAFAAVTFRKHQANRGKGAAIRTGLGASRGRWVLCMDADGSAQAVEVERLLARSMGVGMAAASRRMPDSDVTAVAERKLTGALFRGCLAMMGMRLLRDTQCGFKLYSREAANLVAREGREDGYAFDLEHLLILKRAGLAVVEVGVAWKHVAGGQVRPIRDGLRMLWAAARLRARFLRERRPAGHVDLTVQVKAPPGGGARLIAPAAQDEPSHTR